MSHFSPPILIKNLNPCSCKIILPYLPAYIMHLMHNIGLRQISLRALGPPEDAQPFSF